MKKLIAATIIAASTLLLSACGDSARLAQSEQLQHSLNAQQRLTEIHPFPTDTPYSIYRFNLIRRHYWINGEMERAMSMVFPGPSLPLGYVVLLAPNGGVVGSFPVQGSVTSLGYSLVPYSEYFERFLTNGTRNRWLANPGGVYGTNNEGVFWFTPDGRYMEWNGTYLFSDIPFTVNDPVLNIQIQD